MAITTSTIVANFVQRDGRRAVRERHVDDQGEVFLIDYLAEAAANVNTIMLARVAQLEAASLANELERIATTLPNPPVLRYATITQLGAYIRAKFQKATGPEVGRVAIWLLARTDAQLRTAFGITQGQLDALKIRLQAMADKYNAAQAMVGE